MERKLIKLTSFLGESYQDGFLDTKGNRNNLCVKFCLCLLIALLVSTSYPGRLYWRSQDSRVPQFVHVSSTRICKKKLDGITVKGLGLQGGCLEASACGWVPRFPWRVSQEGFLCSDKPVQGHLFFSRTRKDADLDFVSSHTALLSSLRVSSHYASAQCWPGHAVLSGYKVVIRTDTKLISVCASC